MEWGVRDFHGLHTESLTHAHRIQQQNRQDMFHIHHSLFCSCNYLLEQFLPEIPRSATGLALQALPPRLQEGASLVNGLRLLARR